TSTKSTATPCFRFTAQAAALPQATFSTSTLHSSCSAIHRAAAHSSIRWRGLAATKAEKSESVGTSRTDRRGTIYRAPTFTAPRIVVVRETHEAPENVARRLELAGGRNRFGEANYRAVWGWSRLAWIGGKFEDRDEHGALIRERIELRKEPKYP